MKPAEATGLASVLVPNVPPMNESEAAGLPKDYKAYKLDMQRAWLLALINGRYYQYQLEALYEAALPVTLQRFAFEPQFYAGMSPVTGVPQTGGAGTTGASISGGSFPTATGLSTANSFSYATRYAPTGQVSTLNLGTVAGFGKLFNSGGQLLMGFASELVFNFAGKSPQQPTVLSALPFSFVQPLLRGGGRAVILEPLTNEERQLLYQVREFAQFRQQFFVVTLTGGTVQNFGQGFQLSGFSTAGNVDPVVGYIPAAFNVVQVEIDRRNVAFYINLVKLYQELIQGEASGLSQLQVDQVMSSLIGARQTLFNDKVTYRNQLDQFKMQLGMPPDITIVMDQKFLGEPFYRVFNAVDDWQKRSDRQLSELPGIIGKIPQLQDIDIDGRSVLGIYRNYRASRDGRIRGRGRGRPGGSVAGRGPGRAGVPPGPDERSCPALRRLAADPRHGQCPQGGAQRRPDQQRLHRPLHHQPICLPQPGQELQPGAQRRVAAGADERAEQLPDGADQLPAAAPQLMVAEDNLKVQLRTDMRKVHSPYIAYEINKRNYELNVRLKDQAFEQIVAPPAGGTQGTAQSANAATQTTNLLNFQRTAYGSQGGLIRGYESYQTNRLIFYRDIGTLPYDEWEAFSELFPTEYHGPIIRPRPPGGRDLPTLQKPRRRRVPLGKIVVLTDRGRAMGVGGVAVLSVPSMSKPIKGLFAGESTRVLTYQVRPGELPIAVEERGSLESSQNMDVYCQVEGGTTIIRIEPEGTKVKKGEIICELDSAALKRQLINQRITTKSAEANFLNAKLTREVAEIAVREYVEGVYVQELATVEGEIKLAESDLMRAEDRLDWARRMFEKGYVSMATKVSEELNFKKAQFTLEQAQSKKNVLVKYTREKTIKELESEVKKANSDELAKQATWELEKGKESKLETQIKNCTLIAPIDGLVVYANDPSRMFGSNQSQIEEGATVRERQKVISIPDITPDAGQRQGPRGADLHDQARLQGPDPRRRLRRRSSSPAPSPDVAPLPDPGNIFSSDIKVYTTRIRIDDPLAGPQAGHDRPGEDPGRSPGECPDRSRAGGPPVQWQGPRDQEGRRSVRSASR